MRHLKSNNTLQATRDGFGRALEKLGGENKRIVALSGDLNDSTRVDWFAEKYPARFIQAGIAEQNMVGMAAGLSLAGFIPFAASFGAFMLRAADHIRVSVALSNLNVKLVGTHCGLAMGEDGANAQCLEDIAFYSALPNFKVIVPCDSLQAYKATYALAKDRGPSYLRLGRERELLVAQEKTPFVIGKANVMAHGDDVAIIACGVMVECAIEAALLLEKKGISARVIDMHTIKPMDKEALNKAALGCGCVVTAEQHQIEGGLSSAVALHLSRTNPVPVEAVAVSDRFGTSGPGEELLRLYGLTPNAIEKAALKAIARKKK